MPTDPMTGALCTPEPGPADVALLAGRLDAAADFVTAQAHLVSGGLGVDWTGEAARRFHQQLGSHADDLAQCAHALRTAATAARSLAAAPIDRDPGAAALLSATEPGLARYM